MSLHTVTAHWRYVRYARHAVSTTLCSTLVAILLCAPFASVAAAEQLGSSTSSTTTAAPWSVPADYPASYRQIIDGAKREGQLRILGSTDRLVAEPLMRAFEAAFPGIKVTYSDLNTKDLDQRYRKEAAEGNSPDIVWSSAMDTQIQLLRDDLAQEYTSPETRRLPSWAEYNRQAYCITYEPIVFAYYRPQIADDTMAQTHGALTNLLAQRQFHGKVAMLSPANSALALLTTSQDLIADKAHPSLLRALGNANVELATNNNVMLKQLASGDTLIGYNMLGSYVDAFSRRNPQVGYVIPRDYALVVSRVALIARNAPHPNAARLWLDYVLSHRGQTVLANDASLGSVRDDVDGPFTLRRLREIPGLRLRPIGVSARLLDHLDPEARSKLINQWQATLGLNSAQ